MSTLAETSRTRTVVLLTCCLSVFLVGLDGTIANVALPSIQRGLHAPVSGLQWTIDAYALIIACLLMFSGSLADRLGRRRVFQIGLAIFSAGSLLCSVAPSLVALVAFRGFQAVGASMLGPVAMSIVATTFTEPAARARAVGVWGGVGGLSMASGPVLGGLLVSGLGWRSVFWVNVPIGVLAICLTQRFVPEFKATRGKRFDPLGQLLVVTLLGPVTAAVIEGPRHGWGSPLIIGLFALAAASVPGLIVVERRQSEPLVDVRLFRSPVFSGALVIGLVALMTVGGFLFLNTLYLQDVRGYSPLHAGALTIPMAAAVAMCAPLSGRMVATHGPHPALVLAGLLLAAGTGLLIGAGPTTGVWYLVLAYVLVGAGSGLVNTPITNTALSGLPRDQAAVAGAIASTCRSTGGAIGVAVGGSIVAGSSASFLSASHAAWAVLAGCGSATALFGLIPAGRLVRSPRRARWPAVEHASHGCGAMKPDTSSTDDHASAAQAWAEMLAFITGQDRLRALRLELDLGVGKSELLIKLAQAPMTLREVAQAIEVDPSAATVAVDLLERRGLVQRQAHPGDKRRKLVHLTDAGRRAAATAQRILTDPPPALAALNTNDIVALARIFATLNAKPDSAPPATDHWAGARLESSPTGH